MKILAIRGENLASLTQFGIEFEQDPLAGAGLFAICGPTGAGKSTLLDALCVALFDKTPRLSVRGGVPVGHADDNDRLAANDVRGILRRGAGAGFAEVDFLGRDDRRYRARWEVWRARRKPQGRIQPQQLSFKDLDSGDDLSGTKTETLATIEDRLGLDFEQFRRSALLAQNEFAAFLSADSGMRGELLERMTGTRIYSELSRAAFERHKIESEALRALQGDATRHPVLESEERAEIEQRLTALAATMSAMDADIEAAERALAWHDRDDELLASELDARHALERVQAEHGHEDAQAERKLLVTIERAREYRPTLEAVDERTRALEAAVHDRASAERAGELARAHNEAAAHAYTYAQTARKHALDEQRAYQPTLERAHRLDTEIALAEQAAAPLAEQYERARARAERARKDHDDSSAELARVDAGRAQSESWLQAHAWVATAARDWSRWSRDLERHENLDQRTRALGAQLEELARERAQVTADLERVERDYRDAVNARDNTRAQAESAQLAADQVPPAHLRQQRDLVTKRAADLRVLGAAARRAREARATDARYRDQADEANAAAAAADSDAQARQQDVQRIDIRIEEAEATLARMQLNVQLSAHRASLRADEPCPLCGALEHPHADEPSPEKRVLADQAAHITRLREQRDDLSSARAHAASQAQVNRERAAECTEHKESARAELQRAQVEWHAMLAALGELALMDDPADERTADAVDSRLRATESELEDLAERERTAAELQEQARLAHSRFVSRESDLSLAAGQRDECRQRQRALEQAWRGHEDELTRGLDDMREIAEEFERALGAHAPAELIAGLSATKAANKPATKAKPKTATNATAVRVRQTCERLVNEWRAHEQALAELRVTGESHRARLDSARVTLSESRAALEERERAHTDSQSALAGLRRERAQLFEGRPLVEVRARMEAERNALEAQVRDTDARSREAGERAAAAQEKQRACIDNQEARARELSLAREQLERALERAGLSLDTMRAYCALEQDHLDARKGARDALEQELQRALAVLVERSEQRARHRDSGAPARLQWSRECAEDVATSQKQARALVASERAELEAQLRLDDMAHEQRARMAAQVLAQDKRTRVYQTLSQLIGSADGKKFRVFAQSLTLDALLAYANHHMQDLAGRYRIVRVPGYDLDLQVIDRDLGDEVRSVNSLSGGETFLVSLALALGLSSLAARDTRVESLLIDEGFGSLDPSALDAALSVLDALQATGRQVGLISHVPGLAERVGVRVIVQPRGGGRSTVRVTER